LTVSTTRLITLFGRGFGAGRFAAAFFAGAFAGAFLAAAFLAGAFFAGAFFAAAFFAPPPLRPFEDALRPAAPRDPPRLLAEVFFAAFFVAFFADFEDLPEDFFPEEDFLDAIDVLLFKKSRVRSVHDGI
jgi:hypothetical protein